MNLGIILNSMPVIYPHSMTKILLKNMKGGKLDLKNKLKLNDKGEGSFSGLCFSPISSALMLINNCSRSHPPVLLLFF